ncbi:hypothetical protein [Flavobacterium sp. K5-23]|uniref:hypothetical protein n=1 Tax=Flavobacterium sp. K5-23 TaxID=2746225 RepID=UPI00200D69D9|nr:hypothetical protein [Flavobacterium sp. K5-23]UQD54958.1 hypothetical protein FLAK523_00575 [Flavobacterium sp. K5-23]
MSNNDDGTNILMIIGYIYLTISQIMTLYFWWLWAQDHGFWSSILLGPLLGEFKGLLWIFFVW